MKSSQESSFNSTPVNFPWKRLGFAQFVLFLFSSIAFLDIQWRLNHLHVDCDCANLESWNADVNIRSKRSLKETLLNYTSDESGKPNKDLWVHSLSKIQMDELLEKCLDVHQYCTNEEGNARGPPEGPGHQETKVELEFKDCRPPGPRGEEAHCVECPITENYVFNPSAENSGSCPRVEEMKCPGEITIDGISGPRAVSAVLPSFVEFMLENETETDTCLRICTSNLTTTFGAAGDGTEDRMVTSTETAYIEGATAHCFLQNIGKPVFHAHANTYYGSWMRDAYPRTGLVSSIKNYEVSKSIKDMDKRWLTNHFEGNTLHEFYNEADLRRRKIHKTYKLPHLYKGTNTVFFNGSFYYHRAGTPKIAKYELFTQQYEEVVIDVNAAHKSDNYLFNHSMNYFDLAVDENALWVMFHYDSEDFISVAKLDINNLTIYETWNLTMINHTEVANGFVVESASNLKSEISIAYDFYRQKYRQPNIKWINLYRNANMMSYNPYDKRIYIYDHGYLLTLPARISWRAK
ncbi:Gliomedin [Aphelenchoides besseyi]|nr:Gliomedin [Aphelenchoides besseyi]